MKESGNLDGAIEDLNLIIDSFDKKNAKALTFRATLLKEAGKLALAIKDLEVLVEVEPQEKKH